MKKHQEGAAMIVVMCVMVVAAALSLALLLSSSVMVTNAARANRKEQCRILAVSISDALCKEVGSFEYSGYPSSYPIGDMEPLQAILMTVATTAWPSYDVQASGNAEGPEHRNIISYELDSDTLPGMTAVEWYWTAENGANVLDLDLQEPEEASELFAGINLYLKVTSTVGEESSSIISLFQPGDFVIDPNIGTWSSWRWCYIGHGWEGSDS